MLNWLTDWPRLTEVPEERLAEAYESVSPQCRASIKAAIALAACHFRPSAANGRQTVATPHLGFSESLFYRPCERALLIFPAGLNAAAPVCAAAALPLLSGCQRAAAIAVGGIPHANILATLELCGVEDIYTAPTLEEFTPESAVSLQETRLVLFPCHNLSGWSGFQASLMKCGVSFYLARPPEKMLLLSPEAFAEKTLSFCYGTNASLQILPSDETEKNIYDAVFHDPATGPMPAGLRSRMILEPGCEGFWIFPNLGPDFFILKEYRFAMLSENPASANELSIPG